MTNTSHDAQIPHESYLVQGNRALREGDFAAAIRFYLAAIQATPNLSETIAPNLAMARRRHLSMSSADTASTATIDEGLNDDAGVKPSKLAQGHIGQVFAQEDAKALKLAVVIHAFYEQQLIELCEYLANIDHEFDLFVSVPAPIVNKLKSVIDQLFPTCKLRIVENVGNDVAPFLHIIEELDKEGYDIVCKLHTKRDHEQYKDNWRLCLLDGVLGSKQLVNEIVQTFTADASIDLIGPALVFTSAGMTNYDAGDKLRSIVSLLSNSAHDIKDWGFFAGTIFWARVSMFRPLLGKTISTALPFNSSKSGELVESAHLYERMFGVLPYISGKKIALVDYRADAGLCSTYLNILPVGAAPRRSLPENLVIFSLIRDKLWVRWSALKALSLLDKKWYLLENPEIISDYTDPLLHFLAADDKKIYLNADHRKKRLQLSFSEEGIHFETPKRQRNLIEWPVTFAGENFRSRITPAASTSGISDIKVSIICLTYNHEKYIRETLDSFLSQKTDFRFEIIIGDDASKDATADIIREYANRHPNIFVPILRDKNVGATQNLLDVLSRIKGQYVAMNDGDDYWLDTNKLQIQADYLDEHPECALCFHPVKILNELSPEKNAIFPDDLPGEIFGLEDIARRNFIQTNSVMYRWELQTIISDAYNPKAFPADHYLHTLQAKFGEIHLLPRVMAVYRKNSGGMFSSMTDNSKLLKKYGVAHIELFRSLDRYLDEKYTQIYLAKELEIQRALVRSYVVENNIDELYTLAAHYSDVFTIAANQEGICIDDKPITSKGELSAILAGQFSVSVVVTSYNHGAYLEACLDSILAQVGFFELEVIIADDASTDGGREIAERYATRYPDIVRVLALAPNMGMLKNMKRAFDACTGNFIAICEGDDYWLSERKIHKQLCMLIQNPALSMCFNWLLLLHETTGQLVPHHTQGQIAVDTLTFDDLIKGPLTANFSCCMYRASTIKAIPIKYYTEVRAADWLFNLCAAKIGKVGFLKELLSVYRIHDKGQWSGLSVAEMRAQIGEAGQQFELYFPDTVLPGFFSLTTNPLINENVSDSEDIAYDINNIKIKYNALCMQGWLLDTKEKSNESDAKYIAVTDLANNVLYWQLMESTERADVDRAFSPNDSGRYLWSGFTFVLSEIVNTFRHQKIWLGQSCRNSPAKWKLIGELIILDSGKIEVHKLAA